MKKKTAGIWMGMAAAVFAMTACGKTDDEGSGFIIVPEVVDINLDGEADEMRREDEMSAVADAGEADKYSISAETGDRTVGEDVSKENAATDDLQKRFGSNVISEQTFEAEFSEYEEKVWFVPFSPSADNPDFHMQIIQNEETLTDIAGYVPKELSGKPFQSLDAVSFYDINYDNETDIILIETYGDTAFAAVYYGYSSDDLHGGKLNYFVAQEQLSDNLSGQLEEVSISGIRNFLADGKRNGEFADYREAYEALLRFCALENAQQQYDLIYFDEDDIPELTAGVIGYIEMYTYCDGTIYKPMESGYGVMGNTGYEYAPRKNSLRYNNMEYAGLIYYTNYMRIGAQHSMEGVVRIVDYYFDDVNQNGTPDDAEEDSFGKYSVSYIDGREVSDEECAAYNVGGYQYMKTDKDIEALRALLYTEK